MSSPCCRSGLYAEALRIGVLAAATLSAGAVFAEMSDQEYRSNAGAVDPARRARLEAELAAARASEAAAGARREAEEGVRQRAWAEAQAQRPMGERLLEAHCSSCHVPTAVTGIRRGWLGWRWTVERMRWWHRAALGRHEARVIVEHLVQREPADAGQVWLERSVALAALAVPAAAAACLIRRARRRGSHAQH